jgi:hypothetical protein
VGCQARVLLYEEGLSGPCVIEEVGCQAHVLLKKWVVRPMSILSR